MTPRLIATVLLGIVATPMQAADMDVSDYLSSRDSATTREYVAGLGEGMDWANYQIQQAGGHPTFCVPKNLKLNAQNFLDILDAERTRDPQRNSTLMPVSGVLHRGLVRTFPCKQ